MRVEEAVSEGEQRVPSRGRKGRERKAERKGDKVRGNKEEARRKNFSCDVGRKLGKEGVVTEGERKHPYIIARRW